MLCVHGMMAQWVRRLSFLTAHDLLPKQRICCSDPYCVATIAVL